VDGLDAKFDSLYALPLGEFTAARNALAKTLKGDEAARARRLQKPAVVPWSVNQLYWGDRGTYDRLMAAGLALRTAQVAALGGHPADVRASTAEHRTALAAAVAAATRLAAARGERPAGEPLSRMLEALSLAPEPHTAPGRFTELLRPAGFEALAGLTPIAHAHAAAQNHQPAHDRAAHVPSTARRAGDDAAERRRADAAIAAQKANQFAARQARQQFDRAVAAETRAQAHADAARQQLARTEAALAEARDGVERARRELARADALLKPR
jgi:hypothetical protein